MKNIASVDSKAKGILKGANHTIILFCDQSAQDVLQNAERYCDISQDREV